jgi:prepilin-type processing-associated H-X9-DG protein
MVTFGLIALLLALLLPVAGRAREQGRMLNCLSNLRQIGFGFLNYAHANKEAYPPITAWVYWKAPQNPTPDIKAKGLIPSAMGGNVSPAMFRCPSDDLLSHPSQPYIYSANAQILNASPMLRLMTVVNPSEVILLIDESSSTVDDLYWYPSHYAKDGRNLLSNRHDRATETSGDPTAGRGNVLYCDFHAEFIPRLDSTQPQHWLAYPGQPQLP